MFAVERKQDSVLLFALPIATLAARPLELHSDPSTWFASLEQELFEYMKSRVVYVIHQHRVADSGSKERPHHPFFPAQRHDKQKILAFADIVSCRLDCVAP